MDTYIEKLRRFSLTFGLILLTYSIAGIKLVTPINISPFGISFTIELFRDPLQKSLFLSNIPHTL